MKVRVKLADADRQRLGCPEWMEVDPFAVSMQEAIVLSAGATIEGATVAFNSPRDWRASLGRESNQSAAGLLVLVWLALRRNGVKVPLGEVEFDADAFDYEILTEAEDAEDEPAPDAEGNVESAPETTSPSGDTPQP